MSTALAIAAVSACVRDLIHSHLTAQGVDGIVGSFKVSTRPPDRVLASNAEDPTQVNWYLHRVSPNTGWVNRELPSRDSAGERTAAPPLSLNLHYMLSAFGAQELFAEIVLGHAMQALHETPVLGREAIRRSLAPAAPPPDFPTALATSGLAEQIELVKLTLAPSSSEELSRVWSGVNAHYRMTALYDVSLVLIESRRSARPSLPVVERVVHVTALNRPKLETVADSASPAAPITLASTLRISGTGLSAADARLLLNGLDVTSAATVFTPNEVLHPLAPPPAELRAGIVAVQVVHRFPLGNPPTPHHGVDSNAIAFTLRPQITPAAATIDSTRVVDAVTFKTGTISIGLAPRVLATQRATLLLNEKNPPATRRARGYSFPAPLNNGVVAPATDAAAIVFEFTDVAEGAYVARVAIDGADSPLAIDASGLYAQPEVVI